MTGCCLMTFYAPTSNVSICASFPLQSICLRLRNCSRTPSVNVSNSLLSWLRNEVERRIPFGVSAWVPYPIIMALIKIRPCRSCLRFSQSAQPKGFLSTYPRFLDICAAKLHPLSASLKPLRIFWFICLNLRIVAFYWTQLALQAWGPCNILVTQLFHARPLDTSVILSTST